MPAPKIHSQFFRKGSGKEAKGSSSKAINRKRNGEIEKRDQVGRAFVVVWWSSMLSAKLRELDHPLYRIGFEECLLFADKEQSFHRKSKA